MFVLLKRSMPEPAHVTSTPTAVDCCSLIARLVPHVCIGSAQQNGCLRCLFYCSYTFVARARGLQLQQRNGNVGILTFSSFLNWHAAAAASRSCSPVLHWTRGRSADVAALQLRQPFDDTHVARAHAQPIRSGAPEARQHEGRAHSGRAPVASPGSSTVRVRVRVTESSKQQSARLRILST